jgi:hypothetical protein
MKKTYEATHGDSLTSAAMRANLIGLNARQAELEQELVAIREAKEAIYTKCSSRECAERDAFFGRT